MAQSSFLHDRRWSRAAVAASVSVALWLLATGGVVWAHARYDHSTPAQGETVAASPARVDIFTVQEMKKDTPNTVITVVDPGNLQVDTGDTAIDDADRKHFSVGLKPNLPPGRYLVSFKNVSDEDGEADHGQFAFYVGTGPTAAQKALDSKLAITSKSDDEKKSDSHTGLIIAIVVAVVVVIVLVAGGFAWMRRRARA